MTSSAERFGDGFGGERMWGLRELPYPDPTSLTPETAGWLVLTLLLLLAGLWMVWRFRQRWRADAYRRDGLTKLDSLGSDEAQAIPFILRKTALTAFERQQVASLRGPEWIDWLNARAGYPVFSPGDDELLDQLAYSTTKPDALTFERLRTASRLWVRTHRA